MLEATKRKLREAEFFLGKLRAEAKDHGNEVEAFDYYLSALLSAGRSVTLTWQCEEKEKYDAWFPGGLGNRSKEDGDLLRLMNDQRVETVHRKGAKTSGEMEYVSMMGLRRKVLPIEFGGDGWLGEHTIGIWKSVFDGTDLEVIRSCERYVELLKQMIEDFYRDQEKGATGEQPTTPAASAFAPSTAYLKAIASPFNVDHMIATRAHQ